MERIPSRSPDDKPLGPEDEHFHPAVIDMTGVLEQDDAYGELIYDAINEFQEHGVLPDWGARTLARALANERDNRFSGALHHFAVTGRVDKNAMQRELKSIHDATADEVIRGWTVLLGIYVDDLPDKADAAEQDDISEPEAQGRQENPRSAPEASTQGGPAEQFTAYLLRVSAEAEARGEAITAGDAQQVATMLAALLVAMGAKNPAMIRFAETGDANPVALHRECERIKTVKWKIFGVPTWVEHLERHLASRTDLGKRPPQPLPKEPRWTEVDSTPPSDLENQTDPKDRPENPTD